MKTSLFRALTLSLFMVVAGVFTPLFAQTFIGQDVGTPTLAGSATVNGDSTITIKGGGDDIWNNSDNFYYYYTSVTGLVWEAKMRIVSFEGPDQWSKVNLMVRRPSSIGASPAGDDPHYSAVSTRATGQNEIRPNWRGTRAAGSGDATPGLAPSYPNQWLRVTRTNALFTLYHSTNGVTWTQFHQQNTSTTANGFDGTVWEDPILVGVAVTAHNNGDVNGATAVVSNLSVTVYPVVPPTTAGMASQITGTTNVYAYTEASFNFVATNNATPAILYGMTYEWYKNGVRVSTNSMGPDYTLLTHPQDNNAQIYAIARVNDPLYSSLSVTSGVVTLSAAPGAVFYTNGLKREFFAGQTRVNVEIGSTPRATNVTMVSQADSPGGFGGNYTARFTGYFIPPADDYYVFFVAGDDDTDLFLSTDTNPTNKVLLAQETGWSGNKSWLTAGGGGSTASQKRSDQWSPDAGATFPHANGIHLLAGNLYYFESVIHQGGGGDNWAVTYQTTNEIADVNWPVNFVDGTPTRLTAASNNLVLVTIPGTNINWSAQPPTAVTVYEGDSTNLVSLALTDAEMLPTYQWQKNGANIVGATGRTLNLAAIPASDHGATFRVIATTAEGGLSITSSVTTLTVLQAVFEAGFVKNERWEGQTSIAQIPNLGPPNYIMAVPGFGVSQSNPNIGNDKLRRVTGYFIPPITTNYVFHTTGDDDTDFYISTDNTPANRRLVCQQAGWNTGGNWRWGLVGGGGGIVNQMKSDTWTNATSGGLPPYGGGIPLVAGTRYFIEQDFHQGGGGANNAATYSYLNEAYPVPGTVTRMVGNTVGMLAVRCGYVNFTQHPSNVTAAVMSHVTFSAAGTTDSQITIGNMLNSETAAVNQGKLFFRWFKNGVLITNVNGANVTIGPLFPSDNGAVIQCQMRALGLADNSLNPIWSNSLTATLTVTGEAVFEPGFASVDWWTNTTDKTPVKQQSAGTPHISFVSPSFESAFNNSAFDNYVQRVRALFIPPATSNYVFFVNSDDDSELFLNTSGSSPGGKTLVAQENVWSGSLNWLSAGAGGAVAIAQKRSDQWSPDGGLTVPYSAGIPMTAGQMYWLEGVHHEGGSGDNFAATYKSFGDVDPANGTRSALTGSVIGTYVPRIPWVAFLQQPVSPPPVVSGGNPVTFTALGTNAPGITIGTANNPQITAWITNPPKALVQYQWYKNGNPIPGATASSYTQPFVLPADQGAQFVCAIRGLGYADNSLNRIFSNSVPAVLTVVTDTVPPTISYAATFANTNQPHFVVNVTFSEWMDATTLGNMANYTIAGVNITNISIASNNRTVQLLVDSLPTLPLNVTVSGVKDLTGNTIAPSSTAPINSEKLTFTDVGTPAFDPAYPSIVSVTASGGYIITAQGSDIWNTADGFHFAWEMKTNDFDVVVRGVRQGHTDANAKAGLMVRESLDPSSRNWYVVNNPAPDSTSSVGANNVEANMRDTYAGATAGWKNLAGNIPPTYPNAWVRLKRTGNVMASYASSNMVNWVQLGSYDTSTNVNGSLSNVVYVGICTAAHGNDPTVGPPPPPFLWFNTAEYAGYNSSFVPLAPAAVLTITQSGANVNVSWTPAGGHLEASPALTAPGVNWQNVGTANPATVPIGSGPQFFRVVNP